MLFFFFILFKNFTCEIFYEKFPFAFFPQVNENSSDSLFFLNPMSSWSIYSDNYNQLVNIDTYNRLVKQEFNELHTINNASSNVKDHFQQYYHNFSINDLTELKV